MEKEFNLLEKSQRLRYEAFSVFAAGVNKAESIQTVGDQLASQLKFILDLFLLRIYYRFEAKTILFEVQRGQCLIQEDPEESGQIFETILLYKSLPLYLSKIELEQDPYLATSLFNHPKLISFYALPIQITPWHQMVISIGNKENSSYGEVDFRFLRLLGDLLSSKLSQLLLLGNLESKKRELEQANEKLVLLNQQVQGLNLTLEKKVEMRTHELKKANEELHTIFYRTSHDFRRPLTSILGLTQLAELSAHDSHGLELFTHMKSVVGEMDAMLNKLSILSVIGSEEFRTEAINFNEVCQGVETKMKDKIMDKHINFRYDIAPDLLFYSNFDMITSIVENLVENSIFFHGEHPFVQVSICAADVDSQQMLSIGVKDNGQGIEENHIDKIFDIYYRASYRSKGNGLGLYVVQKLVTLLKGEIRVETKVSQGSTFTILLPFQTYTIAK